MIIQKNVKTTKEQDVEILRIVKEWMRGCSCADKVPSDCTECTMGMAYAIEHLVFKRLKKDDIRIILATMLRGETAYIAKGIEVEFGKNGVFYVRHQNGTFAHTSLKAVVNAICEYI